MSFNIRFGTANDGDNHWDKRQDLLAETIGLYSPDLLGVQEALDFQCEFLKTKLPEHQFIGRSRERNPTSGEFCGIFYRTERFELIDSGHFWLSETPDEPGSKSWDSSLPRMVSWVRLRDRLSEDAEFVFANTHFDHRGPEARLQSAKLIRKRLIDESEWPFVMTGDFNCGFQSEPYQALVSPPDSESRRVHDSFHDIHPKQTGREGTTSQWNGSANGARIDWILHTGGFITLNADIDHLQQQGRFPSDHYPVNAILKLKLYGATK
jgi:endonuclease/exonuclease/phosphatase family metal-dependent hydrolase